MSPAAKRLASKRLGIKTGTDKALQASYSPSPAHRIDTPSPYTPHTPARSKHTTPTRDFSLTDDLLKLPKR
jgi:protein DGCR14